MQVQALLPVLSAPRSDWNGRDGPNGEKLQVRLLSGHTRVAQRPERRPPNPGFVAGSSPAARATAVSTTLLRSKSSCTPTSSLGSSPGVCGRSSTAECLVHIEDAGGSSPPGRTTTTYALRDARVAMGPFRKRELRPQRSHGGSIPSPSAVEGWPSGKAAGLNPVVAAEASRGGSIPSPSATEGYSSGEEGALLTR